MFVLLSCQLESKGVQFTAASDKINRGGLSTVALGSLKIFTFVPQEHQIRMPFYKHDYLTNTGVTRVKLMRLTKPRSMYIPEMLLTLDESCLYKPDYFV